MMCFWLFFTAAAGVVGYRAYELAAHHLGLYSEMESIQLCLSILLLISWLVFTAFRIGCCGKNMKR